MKAILTFTLGWLLATTVFGQRMDLSPEMEIRGVVKKKFDHFQNGDSVVLKRVIQLNAKHDIPEPLVMAIAKENSQFAVPVGQLNHFEFSPETKEDFWQYAYLRAGMHQHYHSKGYNYNLRRELISEAQDYFSSLQNNKIIYEDEFINDYVRSLFTQVLPRWIDPNRPENFAVAIIKSPAPDSYMLPNGTLLLSTGLLSTLESEDELKAIMVSEVAHLIFDHALINVRKDQARIRRAAFWNEFLSLSALVAEEVMMHNNRNYNGGLVAVGTSLILDMVNYKIAERLGIVYTSAQERYADQITSELFTLMGIPTGSLTSALDKIERYYLTGMDFFPVSRYSIQESMNKRKEKLPPPEEAPQRNYIKLTSGVTTFNALTELVDNRYEAAYRTAEINVLRNVPSCDDYIIMAKANMALSSEEADNLYSMELLQQAQELSELPILDVHKQEILLLMRMKKQSKAVERLYEYIELVENAANHTTNSEESNWLAGEASWAEKLITRISLF